MARRVSFALAMTMIGVVANWAPNAHADALQDGAAAWLKGDFASSVRLLTPLADEGNPMAQTIVGGAYAGGWGIEKDCQKALEYLDRPIKSGYARAEYAMGRFSHTGTCVKRSEQESFLWYQKAAAHHDPDADFALGLYYTIGQGTKVDWVEAYRWYSLCLKDTQNMPSLIPQNVTAARDNLHYLNSVMSKDDIARSKRLIEAAN